MYLFGNPPEENTPPTPEPEAPTMNLEDYISFLHERGYISAFEFDTLYISLAPLIQRFAHITTVEAVRQEIGQTQNKMIRAEEADLWKKFDRINNFTWREAYEHLEVHREEDPSRTVRGLTAEIDRKFDSLRYVPPKLNQAEIFFWIILRMCRLQHELDIDAIVEESEEARTPLEVIADRFLDGKMDAASAATEVKEQLPPAPQETTEELTERAMEFVRTTKALVPASRRKSLIGRALGAIFDRIFWRDKWRRKAIETRLP